MVQFGILGALEVRSAAGEVIAVGGPRPRALLVMLLLNAGRAVDVQRLVAGQYGEDPPAGAVNAVQAQVSRLRRSLPADLIEFDGTGYRLAVEPEDVDVHRFERLAGEGWRLLAEGQPADAVVTLREALRLWRGPALVDLPHGQAQASRLEELRLVATEDLIEAELALPDGSSVAELRGLIAAHPLRERFRGQLMRALHAAGRSAEALAEFEEARRLLAAELGADPSPELAATHLAILRAEQPAALHRQGLPAQLTSFVGREAELARLDQLHDVRLVTIIGPGGTGKTRLAVESAARRRREVCFADLSPLQAGDQVPLAILGALGVRESGFQSTDIEPKRRLAAALDHTNMLVVLDNCEHLIGAVAVVARTMLAQCPTLAILATSREPLGLTGETLLPLAPLDPAPLDAPAVEALTYPAVRLFADRAAAVRPGFALTLGNVPAVVEICAALDGLPLAIELAAARLRQFTVEEIAKRLADHDRFRFLSRGDRTAARRHRTLHAAVAWSWDLLEPDEQVLARRFAVFAGGAPLAAVEAVCGVPDTEELLADLMDRSLVDADGQRYRMLDTIRLFCAERLADAGEQESLRRAHARYHLELAQRADPHLRRAEQLDWLARLSAEHDNLMAGLHWAAHRDDPADRAIAARMVAALAAYWWLSGRRGQAGECAAALLENVPDGMAEEYVSCVVHAMPRPGPEHWAKADRIMRTLDRPLRHPFGAALWGMAVGPQGDQAPETAALLATEPWNLALAQLSRALLAVLGGRPADGERELREVLAVFRALGERWGTAQALDWLATVASWRGEWGRANQLWTEAIGLFEQFGALDDIADLLCHRAESLVRQGVLDAAGADYRRAAERSARAGQPGTPPAVLLGRAELARRHGHRRDVAALLHQALDATGNPGGEPVRARVLTALGRLAETSQDPTDAARWHREALAVARMSHMASDLAGAVEGWAGAALVAGDGQLAALLLGAAVALRGTAVAGDADVARVAGGARDLVGAAAFAEAYARGVAMSAEQALAVIDGRGS